MSICTVEEEVAYSRFEKLVAEKIANNKQPLFTTDVPAVTLWFKYLNGIPYNRQYYNCNHCRRFIEQYGKLVTIENGVYTKPLLWNNDDPEVPAFFREAVSMMWAVVKCSKVNGVFYSDSKQWGVYQTGEWTHLCGEASTCVKNPLKTASQLMAEKQQEFELLKRTVTALDRHTMNTVNTIISQGDLYRSEKAVEVAKWLSELVNNSKTFFDYHVDTLIWNAVATAPVGFAHVKNTLLGTLIEDVQAGLPFAVISRRWAEKLHPLQYQRPTAAPTAGNVATAEKIFEKLGLENSIKRRFARLDEIPKEALIWAESSDRVNAVKTVPTGLFSSLLEEQHEIMKLKPTAMSWVKFARDVLPITTKMVLHTPENGAFYGFLTAEDETAPPIVQWDSVDRRNPFTWYFWSGLSSRTIWGLDTKATVLGIMESPATWYQPKSHHGDKLFFILKNCRETVAPGICLFPEVLKSELREVRSTIEAYNNRNKVSLAPYGQQGANGISGWGNTFEVTTPGTKQLITLDRFE